MYVEHRCDVIQTVFSSRSSSLYIRQYKVLEEKQGPIRWGPVLSRVCVWGGGGGGGTEVMV